MQDTFSTVDENLYIQFKIYIWFQSFMGYGATGCQMPPTVFPITKNITPADDVKEITTRPYVAVHNTR